MKLIMSSVKEFIQEIGGKRVYCFGASAFINQILNNHYQEGLALKITEIVDNDLMKQGWTFDTAFGSWNIISIEEFVCKYMIDSNAVMLIMPRLCDEIVEQIRNITELRTLECYIYGLFPFFAHVKKLPDELLAMRAGKPKIPKILHYVWFGGKPLPDKYKQNIESWKKYCPDYEIKLWNEDNYDVYKIPYVKDAYQARVYSFAADCARMDIINKYGGIYFDTDVTLLKPIDDLLYSESFFSVSYNKQSNSGDGFGAVAGNAFTGKMLNVYKNIRFYHNENPVGSNVWKETVVLRKANRGLELSCENITILDGAVLYPPEFFSVYSAFYDIPRITSNTYSLHQYETPWIGDEIRIKREKCKAYFANIFAQGEKKVYELN